MALDTKKLANLILLLGGRSDIPNLGLTKLYKLIFFCDVTHLRDYGESITGSEYIKYPHGPVPSRAEKQLKRLEKDGSLHTDRKSIGKDMQLFHVRANRAADESFFSKEEMATINAIVGEYGPKNAKELSDLSHREPAWIESDLMGKLDPDLMHYGSAEDPDGL